MRTAAWVIGGAVALTACMPTEAPTDEPTTTVAEVPVRLSEAEVTAANGAAGCEAFDERDDASAQHVDEDAPPADVLYERRPAAAGDHLGAWIDAGVYADDAPDERAVVHNHEHGAVSVWYAPDAIGEEGLDLLTTWAEARNEHLANDAGAGVIVAPFADGLDGDAVAFRSWTGGLDCAAFDPLVGDGFLLERFGDAPEGALAPSLEGIIDGATAA